MTPAGKRAAVLGHPVVHSLSPALHLAAYAALGLQGWRYEALDVTVEELPAFVRRLDASWAGLSLTMPLKQAVLPLLDHVEPLALLVGVVNTVLLQVVGDRPPVLVGANTDVPGLVSALGEGRSAAAVGGSGSDGLRDAVVLGGGATAASALAALAEMGIGESQVFVRSPARAASTMRAAHRMGVTARILSMDPPGRMLAALARADVVVSALPPRAADAIAASIVAPHVSGVLLDCAYEPRPTALGAAWEAAGGGVVGGERLLLHQACEQVRLMTGQAAPLAAMEQALAEVLA